MSCLNQSYKKIEIIVVDDNNSDSDYRKETEKFMSQYKDNSKIRYIKMQKNSGGVAARNKGISVAKGYYVAFLDDDDYFLEEKIKKQVQFMKKNDLDASFTANETYDETQKRVIRVRTYDNFFEYEDTFKYHLVEMIVGTQTFMYKKEVLDSIEGFTEIPAGQEYYLMYKTLKANYKVGCLNEILTRICIHSGERVTTGKKKIEAEKFLYNLKKEYFNILSFSQIRRIKYIYKYNIWQRYKSAKEYKQFIWLLYIFISHPIMIIRKIIRGIK